LTRPAAWFEPDWRRCALGLGADSVELLEPLFAA